ncbi:hypothetical protein QYM36_008410, partial [Artemia franciscana]
PMKMLKESMPKNLLLIEKVRKESVPRNQKNSKETGLRLIEKERTESVPRNQKNSKNRLEADRERKNRKRAEELPEQRGSRLAADRESKKRKRAEESEQPESYRLAFRYNPVDDCNLSRCVQIGTMSKIYPYCKALKFNGETMGMCCASGKVKLPLLAAPPEPLKTFLTRTTSESKRFLSKIRKYNSCFQMNQKRKRAEESKEQQGNRLEADRERKNRKRAEESKEQQE